MASYQVKQGDTLSKIAQQNNTTVQNLASLNKIADVNKINVGQNLNLSGPTQTPQPLSTQTVQQPQAQPQTQLNAGQLATQQARAEELANAQRLGQQTYTAQPTVNAGQVGNTQAMGLPTTPQNTASNTAAGAIGEANGGNQALVELQKQMDKAQTSVDKEQSTYDKLLGKYFGKGEATQQAEAQANVPQLQQIAGALTQEYNTKTLSYNSQFQQIMQQTGLTTEQKNNQINAITRNHAYEMTDLSIRQNIAQGNYQAAQAGVDKKIALEYGDLKDLISFQQNILSDAKSSLSDAEKTKLTILNQENERKLAEITYQAHALQDVKTKMQLEAQANGASPAVIAAIQSARDEGSAIAAGGKYIGLLDRQVKLSQIAENNAQIKKLNSEMSGGGTTNIGNLQAYANEFNQTGKIPSATDLAKAGVTVQQVTQYAKQIPKQIGTVIDRNTGVKSQNVSDTQISGIQALYDIRVKAERLKELDKVRSKGLSGGLVSTVLGGNVESEYNSVRKEIVDLMSRARSGAALTEDEVKNYGSLLPGRFANTAFLGTGSQKKLDNFTKNITGTLESRLNTSNLSIQGYSQTEVPGYGSRVIGEVLDIGGQKFKVLSDGTLTDII